MEVKQYKQTEVGAIPEDWEVKPFVSLGRVIDGDRGTNYPSGKDFSNDGHCLFLNAGNVTKAGFRFNECAFVSREKDERLSKGKLKRDDIVLTTRGTVGNFAHFDSAVSFEHIRINSGMVILRNESADFDTAFLYALLQSQLVEKQIERLTFGSAQPQLTVKGINEFWIVAPPLSEQRAIATALSDVDGLLGGLDRLIAKKRDLKQAAMQQLLTGQTRLPGFHGEWEVKQLGDIVDFANGKPHEGHIDDAGEFYLITLDSIGIDGKLKTEHKRIGVMDYSLQKDDIVAILSDIAQGNLLGLCDLIPGDNRYVLNQRVGRLRVKPQTKANPHFLRLQINRRQHHFKARGQGTSQRHVYRRDFDQLELLLPKADEQTAIAEVLTEMDAELAALEQRREKTRALKQAMMQELLSGRIRLV